MVPSPPHVAVGPSWDLFFLPVRLFTHYTHHFPTPSLHYFPKLSHTTLISHNSSGIFIQYCDYLLVFLKKNLEHIRKSYVFFFVSVNIVINLFIVVISLFVSIL